MDWRMKQRMVDAIAEVFEDMATDAITAVDDDDAWWRPGRTVAERVADEVERIMGEDRYGRPVTAAARL